LDERRDEKEMREMQKPRKSYKVHIAVTFLVLAIMISLLVTLVAHTDDLGFTGNVVSIDNITSGDSDSPSANETELFENVAEVDLVEEIINETVPEDLTEDSEQVVELPSDTLPVIINETTPPETNNTEEAPDNEVLEPLLPIIEDPIVDEPVEDILPDVVVNIESDRTVQTEQLQAKINEPVEWIKRVVYEQESTNVKIDIPKESYDIIVKKAVQPAEGTASVQGVTYVDITDNIIIDQRVVPLSFFGGLFEAILKFLSQLFSFTGFSVFEQTITVTTITISEPVTEVIIEYSTEAPITYEEEKTWGKQVTVSSDVHYENIISYTTIPETPVEQISLYWLVDGDRLSFDFSSADTNENGLVDYLEWVTPSLSNQTFDIVLNSTTRVRQVIKGSGTTDSNSSFVIDFTDGTGGLSLQNISKAFHIISYKSAGSPNTHAATFRSSQIVSTTELEIFASTAVTPTPVEFEYTIIEMTRESSILVQRSEVNIQGNVTAEGSFDNVGNLSQTFILNHGHNHNAEDEDIGCEEYDRIRLINETTWEAAVGCVVTTGPRSNKVEIVDWNDENFIKNVQRGTANMVNGTTSTFVTPTTFADPDHTLLFVSARTSIINETFKGVLNSKQVLMCQIPPGNPLKPQTIAVGLPAVDAILANGGTLGPCPLSNFSIAPKDLAIYATLNENGTITIERDSASEISLDIAWELVEFQHGAVNVEHQVIDYSDGENSKLSTIDQVVFENSTAFGTVSNLFGHGGALSSDPSTDDIRNFQFMINLQNSSIIATSRSGTNGTARVGVQVMEFPRIIIVDDQDPPSISDVFPFEETVITNSTITINAVVIDPNIDTVIGTIFFPNGSIQNIVFTDSNNDTIFEAQFNVPSLDGDYNLSITATDTFGNFATFNTTFVVDPAFTFEEEVTDSDGEPLPTQVIITDQNTTTVFDSLNESHKGFVTPGIYNITIISNIQEPFIEITFVGVNISGDIKQVVDLEQLPKEITFLDPSVIYNDIFAINPLLDAEFEEIIYTTIADGKNLYKCRVYDFKTRQCLGQWVRLRNDLVVGEPYSQVISALDPAFGEGSDQLVLKDIDIDGNFSDWAAVLDNSNNVVSDGISGSTDLDVIASAGKDLTKFALTWNDTYAFMFFKRLVGAAGTTTLIVYIDVDESGDMNETDKLARFRWIGASKRYTAFVADYVPFGVADNLTGDGVDMPGNFTNETLIEANVIGANTDKLELEVRIPWSALGVEPGTALQMHISSTKGDGSILPDQVEDNMDAFSSLVAAVRIEPDREGSGKANTNTFYNHTVTNVGNDEDTFDITGSSNQNFNITFTYTNGSILTDTNTNGLVDVGELAPDQSVNITVNISIGNVESGTTDVTTIKANSSSGASGTVVDITNIGDISIVPGFIARSSNLTVVRFDHTVINNLNTAQIIDINASSDQGFETSLIFQNGSAIVDTNGNSLIDLGNVSAGGEVNITLVLTIPNALIGSVDSTLIFANTSSDPSLSGAATDATTITLQIEVEPDFVDVAGIGNSIFYEHEVFNNFNRSDIIDMSFLTSLGWDVELLEDDKSTPLNDTDGDLIFDVGNLTKNGGSVLIVARITVPESAVQGDQDITTITGTSSVNSFADSAIDNTTAEILVTFNDSARTQPNFSSKHHLSFKI